MGVRDEVEGLTDQYVVQCVCMRERDTERERERERESKTREHARTHTHTQLEEEDLKELYAVEWRSNFSGQMPVCLCLCVCVCERVSECV